MDRDFLRSYQVFSNHNFTLHRLYISVFVFVHKKFSIFDDVSEVFHSSNPVVVNLSSEETHKTQRYMVTRMCVKIHSHVTSAFAFFFDLCHPVVENVNANCEHNYLLPENPLLAMIAILAP